MENNFNRQAHREAIRESPNGSVYDRTCNFEGKNRTLIYLQKIELQVW